MKKQIEALESLKKILRAIFAAAVIICAVANLIAFGAIGSFDFADKSGITPDKSAGSIIIAMLIACFISAIIAVICRRAMTAIDDEIERIPIETAAKRQRKRDMAARRKEREALSDAYIKTLCRYGD